MPETYIFVTLIGMILFIYVLFKLIKNHPKTLFTIVVTAIIVSALTLATNRFVFPRFYRVFAYMCGTEEAAEEWIVYDTDPRNDTFIKGRLRYRQLIRLDDVLRREKQNKGLRLDKATVNEIAKYDNEIIDAYDRWRKCHDMRRSKHKTIYPDERHLYHYLRD